MRLPLACFAAVFAGLSLIAAQEAPAPRAEAKPVPAAPAKPDEGEPKKPVKVAQDPGIVRFDEGITVYLEKGKERVEAAGELLGGQSRMLEFLVVNAGGAAHEALIRINGKGWDLRQGLELLGLKEGKKKLAFRGDPAKPEGALVDISVRWKDDKNAEHTAPIEDWVYNMKAKAPLEHGPWVFTGSTSEFREDLNREIFTADLMGNIVATWHDPSCVIDNPRESGADPNSLRPYAESERLPAGGTAVTLVFKAHKAAEAPVEKPADGQSPPSDKSGENQPSGDKPVPEKPKNAPPKDSGTVR